MTFEDIIILFIIIVVIFCALVLTAVFIDLYLEKRRLRLAEKDNVTLYQNISDVNIVQETTTISEVSNTSKSVSVATVNDTVVSVAETKKAPKPSGRLPKITIYNDGQYPLAIKTNVVGQPENEDSKFVTDNKKVVINLKKKED